MVLSRNKCTDGWEAPFSSWENVDYAFFAFVVGVVALTPFVLILVFSLTLLQSIESKLYRLQ